MIKGTTSYTSSKPQQGFATPGKRRDSPNRVAQNGEPT
jgi:hypothetical protein